VPWRKVLAWCGLAVAAVVAVGAVVYVVFWPLSDLIARHDVGSITGSARGAALQTARDAARGRLVALGAGLFAAGALVYTGRNFALSRRTFELTEQSQVTDRYTRAIEQLGSDKGIDVRIGGIYALERIARDSPRDHPTIMEVLAAFIREHSGDPRRDSERQPNSTRPDVQAAATVIGRRTVPDNSGPVNLEFAILKGVHLNGADLAGANLSAADLTNAYLNDADLTGANLTGANLTDAQLNGANLTGAYLWGEPILTGAILTGANLTDAELPGADLTEANLTNANLTGADLGSANLTNASLTGAILKGVHFYAPNFTSAWWPQDAPVPPGWQRDPNGGFLRRA
jgi:hypothetical protein